MSLPEWLRADRKLEQRAVQVIHWPSEKYLDDPVAFARDILGVVLWEKQAEILRALLRRNELGYPSARVCVRSANGVGKTYVAAIAALWWHSLWPDAQIILSAPVLRQVEDLIWKSIRVLHARSGVCADCRRHGFRGRQCEHSTRLDGSPAATPEVGHIVEALPGGVRTLKGFVAVSKKSAVGYFGRHQLWIGDEAAGLRDDWLEAAQSACKGGGSILAIGNPTEIVGFHAYAFLPEGQPRTQGYWTATFTIAALDSPNVRARREIIPDLVTLEWVENCKLLWGEESDLYRIRVLGLHPRQAQGMLLSHGEIALMHARYTPLPDRWDKSDLPDAPIDEGTVIGLDIAGFGRTVEGYTTGHTAYQTTSGVAGDKWVAVVRRANQVLEILKWRTMAEAELIQRLEDIGRRYSKFATEAVSLNFDAEGRNGEECEKLLDAVVAEGRSDIARWQINPVHVSRKFGPESRYGTHRDALFAYMAEWVRSEAPCVPPDLELDDELAHLGWRPDPYGGRERIIQKEDIKKQLPYGRSPDTGDAFGLCSLPPGWNGQVVGEVERAARDEGNLPIWLQGDNHTPTARESRMSRYAQSLMGRAGRRRA